MATKASKTAETRKPSSSAPTAKNPTPKPPEDRPATPVVPDATAQIPVPKDAELATALLTSHHYMQKKDAITAELIVRLISSIAHTEGVTTHITNLLHAVAVLLPKAFQNIYSHTAQLYDLRGLVDKLNAKADSILGLVENPIGADDQTGEQLSKVIEVLGVVTQKTEATEKAVEDTKATIVSFVEQQGLRQEREWSTVGRGNSRSHREFHPAHILPGPANPVSGTNAIPVRTSRPKPPTKPNSSELPPDAICHDLTQLT